MKLSIKISSFLLVISLMAVSCKKEGPAGPAGPTGNADVTVYNFANLQFTGSHSVILPGISRGRMDSSMVLAYYNPVPEAETAWYPIPGQGSGGTYETRFFVFQSMADYVFGLRVVTSAGASYPNQLTFRKLRIFLVPANKFINGRVAGPDLKDYYKVKEYYGIED